ncbi:hypothetical protein ABE61_01920 [Lysinibacillus sphaericus]|uniref:hypothetical protein n=1 Tax=Lysinibacillus sphaericus TaxID=1421 RepID=UPI001A7ECEB4|nr:hypothetical protein [Lysinibacillus sphaericus]MBG9452874.1 hypothetical protein [Lysinibacillus sphaericus]MBG9480081.1 hypothetical protein [Lysinibacillus sphaericus]MBG9593727.1 hypothetical protein [Lysinibacillus sphaericus]
MLNQILARPNMIQALRVEANKGSQGVDMMTVQTLRQHILENWESIKAQILMGTYITDKGPRLRWVINNSLL